MASKLSVTIPDKQAASVRKAVKNGAYASTSEVIRDAIKAWQRQQAEEIEYLRKAWKEGIESGPAVEWNLQKFLAEMHAKQAKKSKAKKAGR